MTGEPNGFSWSGAAQKAEYASELQESVEARPPKSMWPSKDLYQRKLFRVQCWHAIEYARLEIDPPKVARPFSCLISDSSVWKYAASNPSACEIHTRLHSACESTKQTDLPDTNSFMISSDRGSSHPRAVRRGVYSGQNDRRVETPWRLIGRLRAPPLRNHLRCLSCVSGFFLLSHCLYASL